jgi:hypothetical protein
MASKNVSLIISRNLPILEWALFIGYYSDKLPWKMMAYAMSAKIDEIERINFKNIAVKRNLNDISAPVELPETQNFNF